jgi:hypothetical protein
MNKPVGATRKSRVDLSGGAREKFGVEIRRMYVEERMSIRNIVDKTNSSYFAVRNQLLEMGVSMRPAGGQNARRGRRAGI